MKAEAVRLLVALAVVPAAGCASAGRAIGGPELEKHVLANAGPTKLAAALASDLMNRPADDPLRLTPQMAGLRGLLDAPPVKAASAAPADGGLRAAALVSSPVVLAAVPINALPRAATLAIAPPAEAAAPPPPVKKQVFAVALGKFDDAAIASSIWNELASADPLAVKGLSPRLAAGKGGQTLLAGPLEDEDSAAGRCTAFKALGVSCAAAPFEGKPLGGAGA